MKKIFSLVFVLALTTSLWATKTVVSTGSSQIEAAIAAAGAGDTLILQTGEYFESDTRTINKQLTLMAAPDAKPVVKIAKFLVQAPFEVNGIELYGYSSDYMFEFQSDVTGTFALKNCTLRDNRHRFVYVNANKTVSKISIDNCIFKNCPAENAIVYVNGTATTLEMKNSTVYNAGTYAVRVKSASTITIDHCTFCNVGKQAIRLAETSKSGTINVTNCVVYGNPSSTDAAYYMYAGTVSNCVYYNTGANRSGITVLNLNNADPLWADTANFNLNFSFTSPLFLAANDGKHIGDPRWGVEVSSGETVPGALSLNAAVLNGAKISKTSTAISWSANDTKSTASWVINATKAGDYEVILTETTGSGHNYKVSVLDKDGNTVSVSEGSDQWKSGDLNLGTLAIAKADYYLVRLENLTSHSASSISAIMFNYAGGAVVDVPAVLPNEEAMLNGPKIKKTADGIAWNDNGDATQDYAVWNINVAKAGDYTVNMVVSTANSSGHSFSIDIYDSNNQQVGSTIAEPSGDITLAAGTYTVRLNNGTQWSSAIMESVSVFYKGGGVMAIPGQLPAEEALIAGQMIRLENGSIKWPNKSDVASHYATWNVTAAEDSDVDIYAYIGTPSSGHWFTAALYDGDETLISSVSEAETVHTTGEVKLGTISVEDAGTYTIRLTNATEWSSTIVDSLVVKVAEGPIEITLDEEDTENADLTTYLGKTVNVNLVRSMPTGMFSTICLPFGASKSGQFVGAKIYYLDSTYIKGTDEVVLCFKENSDFYQGIPYIIEPATAVNNPRFENVVITKPTAGKTEKTHAIFQGTYFATHLAAGNENLLYLGENNTLYFPNENDTESMNGLRAYFEIKQTPSAPIRRASIHTGTNVITTLDLVDGKAIPEGKFMLNGQIIIRANGQDYLLDGTCR